MKNASIIQRRSIDFQRYFRDLYRSRYSRLNNVYVYENLRIVMAYNFSFRTNIQFLTSRYVVHYIILGDFTTRAL